MLQKGFCFASLNFRLVQMKGYQMTEKKEPEYIGRYGEVLEDVQETKESLKKRDPKTRTLEAIGLDDKGNKRRVVFQVSRKTNRKYGSYLILMSEEEKKKWPYACEPVERCQYINDRLDGEDCICLRQPHPLSHGSYKRTYFLRGRQLEGKEIEHYNENCTEEIFGRVEKKKREQKTKKARDIRKFLEDASIVEAIKTGDPVKVRNVAARVAMRSAKKKDME